MKDRVMALENRGDNSQRMIACPQRCDLRNREMFPRNESERQGRNRAKDLRDKDDVFSTDSIGQMAGGQRQRDYWHRDDQSHQTKRSRRMGARVTLPFNGHGQDQTARDREQLTSRKQAEAAETASRSRLDRPALPS